MKKKVSTNNLKIKLKLRASELIRDFVNLPYKYGKLPYSTAIDIDEISWTFRKYLRTTKPPVIVEKLPYKYGKLPSKPVINGNNISWTIQKCLRTTKPLVIVHNLTNNTVNYPIVMS